MSTEQTMRVLVTGAQGFIGKNLIVHLSEMVGVEVFSFVRGDSIEVLNELVAQADSIVHLAGENRPADIADFTIVNINLTRSLCEAIVATGRNIPLILASSTQAESDTLYGQSKRATEQIVERYATETGNHAVIYRLPGVFGKWCKPNYNSVVATFCHNIARDLPIQVNDAEATLLLVYIDDVVDEFLRVLKDVQIGLVWSKIEQTFTITLGELSVQITAFKNCRTTLISERVGTGLTRALYATYISYLQPEQFVYDIPMYSDERGIFAEMLKTADSGQFSFFTVHSGVTRGSHYHHSKTEKFLVVSGVVRMRFRQLVTGETFNITVSNDKPQVVDSIPGWAHDITNVGVSEAVVMLWANERFDRQKPDCIPCEV
jgi:UDP-2-acetamido-2,6-beta-L-arabino-hexul-4-ose reductase